MIRRLWPVLALASLVGCAAGAEDPRDAETTADEIRIVSLAPHLTELIYSAGAGDLLVGAVSFSDYPRAARAVPRVGDAFRIDAERLAVLEPTMLFAWEGGNPEAVLERLARDGYRVERFATQGLEGISSNLRRIGRLTGSAAIAEQEAAAFDERLSTLRDRYAGLEPVSVFVQVGEQPLYTVSDRHAIGQIVTLCGGRNVFADVAGLAASVSEESVVAANPQAMITVGSVASLARWQRFDGRAVRAGHLFAVDADAITRDSLRILDGAAQLCEQLERVRSSAESA